MNQIHQIKVKLIIKRGPRGTQKKKEEEEIGGARLRLGKLNMMRRLSLD